jgi:cytochrome c biogenesis protein
VLGLLAVVGMTIRQLPTFAFRSPTDYANEMDRIHGFYDGVFGRAGVDLLERLQVFQIFTSTWFSVGLVVLIVSIVVCTLDRTPRLWSQSAEIRLVQPETYYDPDLPGRVRIADGLAPEAVRRVLRRHRYGVRLAEVDGVTYVYGDRHRWSKLLTLLTHLGLITFLVAAAITSRFGDEQGLVVAEGDTLTVGPIGTPGLLLVKNLGFEAPGFETGNPTDFTTDLAVYRDGVEIGRKTIRVNDPLAVAGYTFHQNGFGPAPNVVLRDGDGRLLWSGPIALTDSAAGLPYGIMSVPGRADLGLQLLLNRLSDGTGVVLFQPYRVVGEGPDGAPITEPLPPVALAPGERRQSPSLDLEIELAGVREYTLLIAKSDPGQGLVWAAAALLLAGIVGVGHFPRRRVWGRLGPDGSFALAGRTDDRSVDFDAELRRLVDGLVAARVAPARVAPAPAAPPAAPPADSRGA